MRKILAVILTLLFIPFALADVIITKSKVVSVTPTVSSGVAYTAGDAIGGLQTIAGAAVPEISSGVVHSIVITDLAKQSADIDVIIFSANPSATTFTDNAALDIADADLTKVICMIQVYTHSALNDNGVSSAHGTGCVFKLAQNATTLYAALVARSTPTLASTSDITVRYGILQD